MGLLPSSATVMWAAQADPDSLVYNWVAAVVGTAVDRVSVVDTAASWEFFNNAETHAGQRVVLPSGKLSGHRDE